MREGKDIVFLCGAKDFHAVDKFRITSKSVSPRRVIILTDTIEGEGQNKLINENDLVYKLFIIDRFTFKKQSSIANIWRNVLKILFIPVQIFYLKKFYKKHPDYIYHAIPMYYMFLCYLAKVPFIGTPQGSEILVRPHRSSFYKKYVVKSLKAATHIIVDSINMQNKIQELASINALILKNGFDTKKVMEKSKLIDERNRVLSMRGLNPNYRIHKILEARSQLNELFPLTLVYPACESDYKEKFNSHIITQDFDMGRVERDQLYSIMGETLLAISIPESDSSPRSVYECIFAGACVAVTYSPYIDELPQCMKNRIYIVNIEEGNWLDKALFFAKEICKNPYIPSEAALNMCDENRTIQEIIKRVY